jgi:hypothetical protein
LVDHAIKALEGRAEAAWTAHIDHEVWIPANLWAAFQEQPNYGQHVHKALLQDQQRDRLRRLTFLDAGSQRQYEQLQVERSLLLERLPDISDQEVNAFVIAAGASGAPLSALTPTVREWLSENGLMESYLIRQRAT